VLGTKASSKRTPVGIGLNFQAWPRAALAGDVPAARGWRTAFRVALFPLRQVGQSLAAKLASERERWFPWGVTALAQESLSVLASLPNPAGP
jgi:hypothetical protein